MGGLQRSFSDSVPESASGKIFTRMLGLGTWLIPTAVDW